MKQFALICAMFICIMGHAQDIIITESGELPMRFGSCDTRQLPGTAGLPAMHKSPRKASTADTAPLRYIDRISNLPAYLLDFYTQYSQDVKDAFQGKITCLVNPMQSDYYVSRAGLYAYTVKTYEGEVSFTYTNDTLIREKAVEAVSVVIDRQWDEFLSFIPYVCCSMNLDFPEAFWIGSSYNYFNNTTYNISYNPVQKTGKVKYEHGLYFTLRRSTYDIRRDEFWTEADVTEGISRYNTAISNILADYPDTQSRYDCMRYLNDWLTTHNCYSSILSGYRPTFCYSPLSALEGTVGINGPVCEGYARALKVLCDQKGIPCVLQTGRAQSAADEASEDHMWNYVQMEDGGWYAIDVTWNDPTVSGVREAVSGSENRFWFLLGSETPVSEGFTFIQSHPENPGGGFVPQGTQEWKLIAGPQLAREGIEPPQEPEPEPVFGDIDGDGVVTVTDITTLINAYLSEE